MKGSYRTIGLVTGVAALSSLAFAGTAAAHHAGNATAEPITGCNQVVTASLTLTHNVGPCPNDGLFVPPDLTAVSDPAITINLNGNKVYGLTSSTDANGSCALDPYSASLGAGVHIEGRSNVTVQGAGTTRCFSGGVESRPVTDPVLEVVSEPADNNTVTGLTIEDNVGNVLSDWGEGIGISGANGCTITNNTVTRNGPFAGIGLYGSSNCTVDGNIVSANKFPVQAGRTNQDDGIRVEINSADNIVTSNTVTGSGLDGIALFSGATGNQVNSNTVKSNGYHTATHRKGDGIRLFSGANANTLKSNTVGGSTATTPSEGNAANGIYVASDNNNIGVDGSGGLGGNTVAGNAFTADSARGSLGGGIFLEGYLQGTTVVSADGNKVKANTVTNNSAHGIHVGGDNNDVGGSTIAQGNTATANAFSGILADAYALTGAKAENNKVDGNSATGNNTSVGGWSNLHDLRADLKCGNVEGLPNKWGNLLANTGTKNRDPLVTLFPDCMS